MSIELLAARDGRDGARITRRPARPRPGARFIAALALIVAVQLVTAEVPGARGSQRAPLSAGRLASVACLAGGWCIAVGSYSTQYDISIPLIEQRSDGRWAQRPLVRSTDFSELDAVSCASRRSCMAVGYQGPDFTCTPAYCPTRPLAARWNGKLWTREPVPTPPLRTYPQLLGVSCAAGFCMAVGHYTTPSLSACTPPQSCQARPLVLVWTGGRWRTLALPGVLGSLSSVSCSSRTACTAVGAGSSDPLAVRYNGHAFTSQRAASVPHATHVALDAVSCPSPRACTAIGNYIYDSPQAGGPETGGTFAEHWISATWTILPGDRSFHPASALSCTTADSCTAVGSATDGTTEGPAAEHWNGTTWRNESPRSPPHAPGYSTNSNFTSVSCPTRALCVAVGSENYTNETTYGYRTLAETRIRRTWKIERPR